MERDVARGKGGRLRGRPMVEFVEVGSSGPLVVLIHSSVSGARMWRRLMEDLQDRYRVRAVLRILDREGREVFERHKADRR